MNGYYVGQTYASTDAIHWTRRTVPYNDAHLLWI